MPRDARRTGPHDDELEDLDPEGPSADDLERFGSEFHTCPNCGAEVYDQAEVCPKCLTPMNATPSRGMPTWAIFAACVVLVGLLLLWVL
ncbi:MAG: zinc-ribbon domain-containing protein [Phycisphaerales bacterium]|jgi:hypothetical protein|nr:zinc-ribbon domain-containing protein [Phycisphaerales bacterium]